MHRYMWNVLKQWEGNHVTLIANFRKEEKIEKSVNQKTMETVRSVKLKNKRPPEIDKNLTKVIAYKIRI